MKHNKEIIKCPCCGAEYLPGEIFLPKYFVGQPKVVEKDYTGKILFYNQNMDLEERYTCDKCNTPFIIKANVYFDVREDKLYNFSNNYVTNIKRTPLFLDEK